MAKFSNAEKILLKINQLNIKKQMNTIYDN